MISKKFRGKLYSLDHPGRVLPCRLSRHDVWSLRPEWDLRAILRFHTSTFPIQTTSSVKGAGGGRGGGGAASAPASSREQEDVCVCVCVTPDSVVDMGSVFLCACVCVCVSEMGRIWVLHHKWLPMVSFSEPMRALHCPMKTTITLSLSLSLPLALINSHACTHPHTLPSSIQNPLLITFYN